MPFKSEKQRRWMFANKPAMAKRWAAEYKQEGGPLAPVGAATGLPAGGHAAAPIADYLAGNAANAPLGATPSYRAGAAGADQASRIAYEAGKRQLNEAGIEDEGLVYRDWTSPEPEGQTGWADWDQTQRDRFLKTGTTGHLLAKDDRADWQRGVNTLTADQFGAEIARRNEQGIKVPGVMSGLASGIGGVMRQKMQAAVDAGGVPIAINGQLSVVNPDGSVIGNTGPLGAQGVREYAQGQGLIAKPQGPEWLTNITDSISGIIGQKKTHDQKVAEEAERARAEASARLARARAGAADQYQHESSGDHATRTQAAMDRIDWSAPSDADLEDVYGGTDWSHGWNRGGRVAMSMIEDAPLAQANRTATPAGMPAQQGSMTGQLKNLAMKTAAQKMLGGGFWGQAAGIVGGFNMGGEIPPGHHRMPQGHIMPDSAHYEEGGKIKLNPANKGKFTAKAKAAGMGTQAYAKKVLSDPNASAETRKQANFARNAAKWHKNEGGMVGPLSSVKYKKMGGKITEEFEQKYHNPIQKPSGDKDGN